MNEAYVGSSVHDWWAEEFPDEPLPYDEIPAEELLPGTTSGRQWHSEADMLDYLQDCKDRGLAVIYEPIERDPYGP